MGKRRKPVFHVASRPFVYSENHNVQQPKRVKVTTHSYNFCRLESGRLGARRSSRVLEAEGLEGNLSDYAGPSLMETDEWVDMGGGDDVCGAGHSVPVDVPNSAGKKDKRKRDRTNKSKLVELLPLRDLYLAELVRHDGRGDALSEPSCYSCEQEIGEIRCLDCFATRLLCRYCALDRHRHLPLHRIKLWNGSFFEPLELRDIGVVIHLGHAGKPCPVPAPARQNFLIFHTNGVHNVNVNYCNCSLASTGGILRNIQLLRVGLFPATTNRPQTAFSFALLDMFHKLTLQGKTTMYDYHEALLKLSDNTGRLEKLSRNNSFSVVMRFYKHLKMLKRAGRAHDPLGISATTEGSLAVECPACPHPGRNLPDSWGSAPDDIRWIYTLFLAIDANFRLKSKDRGIKDVELSPGWAYFVESDKYMSQVRQTVEAKEKSTCRSHHSAIAQANTRHLQGYTASGTGAVVCGRHSLVRHSGVGDLQKGEKYVNMDYIVLSTLSNTSLRDLFMSYDIACQWSKNFVSRMLQFPPSFHINLERARIRYGIPKFHLPAHGPACQTRFSLNFLLFVARTYGEGVESSWSYMNGVATSTREMAPGLRHETIDDHWGAWNWAKIVALGWLLLKNLREAVKMYRIQSEAYAEFTRTFPAEQVIQWRCAVEEWNADPTKPDPYAEPTSELSVNDVRLQLAQEDAEAASRGVFPDHEISASVFVHTGLELEDQQRNMRVQVATSRRDLASVSAEIQEAQNVLGYRIRDYRCIQNFYMPIVSTLRTDDISEPSDPTGPTPTVSPENLALWLPSSLPAIHRTSQNIACLINIETTYRKAQMEDALAEIRRQRRVYQGLVNYKVTNVSGTGQKANTRMRALIARVLAKVDRAAEKYRAARSAMCLLEPSGDWQERYRQLRPEDVLGPRMEDESNPVRTRRLGEGRRELPWIWRVPPLHSELPESQEFDDSLRVEWAKSKARMDRWREEVVLLLEEMRRTLEFLQWQQHWWVSLSTNATHNSTSTLDGLRAYAKRQADIRLSMARRFAMKWAAFLKLEDGFLQETAGVLYDEVIAVCGRVQSGDTLIPEDIVDKDEGSDVDGDEDEDGDGDGDESGEGVMPAEVDHIVIPLDL